MESNADFCNSPGRKTFLPAITPLAIKDPTGATKSIAAPPVFATAFPANGIPKINPAPSAATSNLSCNLAAAASAPLSLDILSSSDSDSLSKNVSFKVTTSSVATAPSTRPPARAAFTFPIFPILPNTPATPKPGIPN